MILVRYLLIALIVYLIVRSFMNYHNDSKVQNNKDKPDNNSDSDTKKISKSIGEYVDYEEVRKEDA